MEAIILSKCDPYYPVYSYKSVTKEKKNFLGIKTNVTEKIRQYEGHIGDYFSLEVIGIDSEGKSTVLSKNSHFKCKVDFHKDPIDIFLELKDFNFIIVGVVRGRNINYENNLLKDIKVIKVGLLTNSFFDPEYKTFSVDLTLLENLQFIPVFKYNTNDNKFITFETWKASKDSLIKTFLNDEINPD